MLCTVTNGSPSFISIDKTEVESGATITITALTKPLLRYIYKNGIYTGQYFGTRDSAGATRTLTITEDATITMEESAPY